MKKNITIYKSKQQLIMVLSILSANMAHTIAAILRNRTNTYDSDNFCQVRPLRTTDFTFRKQKKNSAVSEPRRKATLISAP